MEIETWAKNINKEVYEKWKRDYPLWDSGFKVFYSPVRKNPKLMILSYNPGGNETSFQEDLNHFEKGSYSGFMKNEYLTRDYPMAKKIRAFFEENCDLLETSVTLPIIFFRSKNTKYLKKNFPKELQHNMENFCLTHVKRIIETVNPQSILILGFETYSVFRKYYGPFKKEVEIKGEKNRRIGLKAYWGKIPLFCILHPTGARISNTDVEKNKKSFFEFIK